MTTRVVDKTTS